MPGRKREKPLYDYNIYAFFQKKQRASSRSWKIEDLKKYH